MNVVTKEDGTVSNKQKNILEQQTRFYRNLYATDVNINFSFISNSGIKLSEDEKAFMNEPISLEELTVALKSMKWNKTPGCDGLSMELCVYFWNLLGPVLLKALQLTNQCGHLHNTARRGIISLIPKKTEVLGILKIGGHWLCWTLIIIYKQKV